jgi:hypothetical protein
VTLVLLVFIKHLMCFFLIWRGRVDCERTVNLTVTV